MVNNLTVVAFIAAHTIVGGVLTALQRILSNHCNKFESENSAAL